jgi:hypothetical protein
VTILADPLWYWAVFLAVILLFASPFLVARWDDRQDRLDREDHEAWDRWQRGEP